MREIIFFDTEYTAWEGSLDRDWSGKNEYREIIQIGAVRVNEKHEVINRLDLIVKPRINYILSTYIKNLTGISQERLNNFGVDLLVALVRFEEFCNSDKSIFVVSNGGDDEIIRENLKLNQVKYNFSKINFFNVQPLIQNLYKKNTHISIENLGIEFGIDARHHSALNDSETLFNIVKKLRLLDNLLKME